MGKTITAKNLLKTEGILTCSPSDTLSQALAKLNSSHDAVFVFENNQELLGVISPYYVLFQSNFPSSTKVKNCLFSPPKISENTPYWEIARNMMESKVYYLPVYSAQDEWLGIVSYRSLFRTILNDKSLLSKLNVSTKHKMITIEESATLTEARNLLTTKKISRLPVVNQGRKLVGILTRFDLRLALSEPKDSLSFLSRSGEKKKFTDKPIRNYYKKSVVTVSEKTSVNKMISTLLEKEIGSLIVVNSKWQPVGIITNKDLLKAIANLGKSNQTTLELSIPDNFRYEEELTGLLTSFAKKLLKRKNINRLEAVIKTINNPIGKEKIYQSTIRIYHPNKSTIIGSSNSHDWNVAVSKALAKIESQFNKA